ncbi:MAG: T9SS type A sorting domain-containing protein, partial [Bacteroidales bacterium]|nr:T9SS type A sorting domain-containing protein [Bacteroidales bacterium]
YARNILINDSLITYSEPLYFPDLLKSNPVWDFKIPDNDKELLMKIFPNPAGNYFIIEYDLSEFQGNSILVISDINGKQLKLFILKSEHNQLIISTEYFKSGTYLVQLMLNGTLKESTKIVIIK